MCPSKELQQDILWSDPFDGCGERCNMRRGIGMEFGADITNDVCKRLHINRIIRSHQPGKAMIEPAYK
jgi:protein phosphatase